MLGVLSALALLNVDPWGGDRAKLPRSRRALPRRDRRIARLSSVGIEARWRAGLHVVV